MIDTVMLWDISQSPLHKILAKIKPKKKFLLMEDYLIVVYYKISSAFI